MVVELCSFLRSEGISKKINLVKATLQEKPVCVGVGGMCVCV